MLSLKPGAKLLLALAGSLFCAPALTAELQILQLEQISPSVSLQPQVAGRGASVQRLRFDAWSRRFELLLEPNSTLLPGGAAVGGAEPLRGTVAGLSGSWVRLTRHAGGYTGLFYDGAQYYVIDTAAAAARASSQAGALDPSATVVYRLADTVITGALFEGDTVEAVRTGADAFEELTGSLPPATAEAVLATRRLDVGVVVDHELALLDGPATTDNVVARMNFVDGIFSEQVGVHLQLLSTTVLDGTVQPFSSDTPGTLLDQLSEYRRTSAVEQGNGLTHLMTGRNLDGQTVGIAFISSICDDRFAASLSEARNSIVFDALIAAHEIGHTFGAPHDGDAAKACASTPLTFLMAPQLNSSSTFSDCSLTEIAKKVATASCLAPIAAADGAIGAALTADLALNQATTVAFNVRSVGNTAVNDVVVEVILPANVVAAGAGAELATCDLMPGRIVCNLGNLAPGASRAIEMSLLSSATGSRDAALNLTASNDGLAQNNHSTLRLTTSPGADLTVLVAADTLSLAPDQMATVTVTLRNLGLADASDAQLTTVVPAGLTVTSLTTTGISCTMTATSITCPAQSLAEGAQASLVIGLRAAQVGSPRLAFGFNATAPDPQPGNNDAGVTFSITAPPPPATPVGSGGGGNIGVALLLWLAGVGWLRRRHAQTRRGSL